MSEKAICCATNFYSWDIPRFSRSQFYKKKFEKCCSLSKNVSLSIWGEERSSKIESVKFTEGTNGGLFRMEIYKIGQIHPE